MADSKKYDGGQWEHSLRKETTATEIIVPPTTIYCDGSNATLSIKGNTSQSGTPTPSSPVPVLGVGELVGSDYQIPILNGQTTTPVYLGSTSSTRQIKKLVLTGNENLFIYQGLGYIRLSDGLGENLAPYCDKLIGTTSQATDMEAFSINQRSSDITPARLCIKADSAFTTENEFRSWLASNQPTVWYVLQTATTAVVNEPLMKIGTYADSISGVSLPTTDGANTITVDTTVQPSEVSATYTGWHDSSVKEWDGTNWD